MLPEGTNGMNILNAIRLALWSPKLPGDPEKAKRESTRRIVRRLARGNVRLQQGKFSTREDLDERRRRAKSYDFSE